MSESQLSLSDFFRDPIGIDDKFAEFQYSDDAEFIKEYGIGIDCHLKFI